MNNVIANHKTKHKDEIRAEITDDLKRKMVLETTEGILLRILEKPNLWLDPAFKQIYEYVTSIGNVKDKFPPPERTNTIGSIDEDDGIVLSNHFVTGVYNRTILSETDYSSPIITLQVFNLNCRHKTYFCTAKRQSIMINYISFFAVDASGNIVSVKLASQMHSIYVSGVLENGSIVNLKKFQVIYFNYDEVNQIEPTNLVVLALNLVVVGKKDPIVSEGILKRRYLQSRKSRLARMT